MPLLAISIPYLLTRAYSSYSTPLWLDEILPAQEERGDIKSGRVHQHEIQLHLHHEGGKFSHNTLKENFA